MKLDMETSDMVHACLNRGLLINSTGGKILRFVPPLIITTQDIDQAIKVLDNVMEGQ